MKKVDTEVENVAVEQRRGTESNDFKYLMSSDRIYVSLDEMHVKDEIIAIDEKSILRLE
jgi:hypothetical protein